MAGENRPSRQPRETEPRADSAPLDAFEARGDRAQLDRSIDRLIKAAEETGFTDFEIVVELATTEIQRGSLVDADDSSMADFDRAAENLARASLIDERSHRVKNQLALLHLGRAKALARKRAMVEETDCVDGKLVTRTVYRDVAPSTQQLDLAMGICLRAIREEPTYAPVHNTTALVAFELGDAATAIRELQVATQLDPGYVDAYANLGAVLLSLRSFAQAERAFDRVLAAHPDDYDAHLGRALARRGQISEENFDTQLTNAELDLDRCKQLDPDRPEAYFNEALLTERFKVKAAPAGNVITTMMDAAAQYHTFIAKAGDRPQYARQVRIAKEELQDVVARPKFIVERCSRLP